MIYFECFIGVRQQKKLLLSHPQQQNKYEFKCTHKKCIPCF